jgi:hypothetical protein
MEAYTTMKEKYQVNIGVLGLGPIDSQPVFRKREREKVAGLL